MKSFILPVIPALFFLIACNSGGAGDAGDSSYTIDSNRLVTIRYCIEGMTCPGCEYTINDAVYKVPGVTKVHSSFKEESAEITYDSSLVIDKQIKIAVEGKGYTFKGRCPKE